MTNRFPLVIDTSLNKIEELPVNDNLDLTYNGISIDGNLGQAGQVIVSTGFATGNKLQWAFVGDVTTNGTQTLRNKSINASQNTLTNIPNDSLLNKTITINGTPVQLGGSIDTYTPYSTLSGVLTNKTISGSQNTLSNIPNSALVNYTITLNGTPVPLGGSFNTAGDVTLSGVQTLTNKTIDATLNTLQNIPNSSLQYSNLNINGTSVPLGGTVQVGDVTTTGVQVLTDKIIDGTYNSLQNIPNSALVNRTVNLNGVTVTLGSSATIRPLIQIATPPSPTTSGVTGSLIYQSGYLYVCVDTNTWVRFAKDNTYS